MRKLFGWGRKEEKKDLTINHIATGRLFGGPMSVALSRSAVETNSVIGACMDVLTSAVAMAPLIVERKKGDAWEQEAAHDLLNLLHLPSTGITGYEQSFARLMWGVTWSDRTDGNAYMLIVKSVNGQPIGVQYVPHSSVAVEQDAMGAVTGYRVSRQSGTVMVPVEDMIHITAGIDPTNPVMGLSPLKAAMREVLTDNEISAFTHSLMKKPFPGAFIGFKDDDAPTMSAEQQAEFDIKLKSMFSGEGRGGYFFTPSKLEVTNSGFSPNEMALDRLSDRPEERICAVLGVPPIVANMGAGLARSTFSNYEEAKRAFYDTTVSAVWRRVESALNSQFIRKAGKNEPIRFRFDTRGIKALAESEDALAARAEKLFRGNVVNRGEARQMLGLEATPEDLTTWAYQLGPGALMLGGSRVRASAEENV